jgi:hypothetical protein
MKQVTNKELEQERINIEKQAKVMYNGMASTQFDAQVQKMREEQRLLLAENKDLKKEIVDLNYKKPVNKPQTFVNTVLPTAATAVAGSIVAGWMLSKGMLPGYTASDINDMLGVGLAGLAAGGMAGLINSINYCTKPVTKAIINRQIAKKQKQIDANIRRNNAIVYMESCLWNEEQRSLNDEEDPSTILRDPNGTNEVEGQLDIDDYLNGRA